MPSSKLRIRLVVPGNVRHNSGGNVYNTALAGELAALGADVELCRADGGWPACSAEDRWRFGELLHGLTLKDPTAVNLVDGLIASGAPDQLERAAAEGRPAWILLHMPLEEYADSERRAADAAAGVICTSSWAAALLRDKHGLDGIRVALPGVNAAELATGSDPPHLVAVAALLPNKNQLLLLDALAKLTDLPWTASLVGSDAAEPDYARTVRSAVVDLGLESRIRVTGQLSGEQLDDEWRAADLSLLISRTESYGLVVIESLARGIPAVVRAGTGAVEALQAGALAVAGTAGSAARARVSSATGGHEGEQAAVPGAVVELAADPAPLAELLRRWLTDPQLRASWRSAALVSRQRLPGWRSAALTVLDALKPGRPDA